MPKNPQFIPIPKFIFPNDVEFAIDGAWFNPNTGELLPYDSTDPVDFQQYGSFIVEKPRSVGKTRSGGNSLWVVTAGKITGTYDLYGVNSEFGEGKATLLTSSTDQDKVLGFLSPSTFAGQVSERKLNYSYTIKATTVQNEFSASAAFRIDLTSTENKDELKKEIISFAQKKAEKIRREEKVKAVLPVQAEDFAYKTEFKNLSAQIEILLLSDDGALYPNTENRILKFNKLADFVTVTLDIPLQGPYGLVDPEIFCEIIVQEDGSVYLLGSSVALGGMKMSLLFDNPANPFLVTGFEQTSSVGRLTTESWKSPETLLNNNRSAGELAATKSEVAEFSKVATKFTCIEPR